MRVRRSCSALTLATSMLIVGCTEPEAERSEGPRAPGITVLQSYGNEAAPLTHVGTLAPGPGGLLAVVHGPPSTVLLFGSDGTAVQVGGPGSGPAEYGLVSEVGFVGDTLWVTDTRSSKAIFFGLDGSYIRDERVSVPGQGPDGRSAGPVRPLRGGSMLASTAGVPISGALNGRTPFKPFLRVRDNRVEDTIYTQELPPADFIQVDLGEGRFLQGLHPLPQRAIFVTEPSGGAVWVVDRRAPDASASTTFAIHRIGLSGDTIWSQHLEYLPIALTDDWSSSWYEGRADLFAESMNMPVGRLVDAFRDAARFPRFFPPVADARAGTDGRLWLRASSPDTLQSHWLVVAPDGGVSGRLRAPPGFRLLDATADEVFGVMKDEFDVQTVVRATYTLESITLTGN